MELGESRRPPPDLWGHCIFCVRKLSSDPIYQTRSGFTRIEKSFTIVVPPANLSSSSEGKLLQILNSVWPYMQNKGGGESADISLKQIMTTTGSGSGMPETSHYSVLPPICQFCAEEVLQLGRLVTAVRSKVALLRRIISNSKKDGLHSWRMENFEEDLKSVGLGEEEVATTLAYWDDLGNCFEQKEEGTGVSPRKKLRPTEGQPPFPTEFQVVVDSNNRNVGASVEKRTSEDDEDERSIESEQDDSAAHNYSRGDSDSKAESHLTGALAEEEPMEAKGRCFDGLSGDSGRIPLEDPFIIEQDSIKFKEGHSDPDDTISLYCHESDLESSLGSFPATNQRQSERPLPSHLVTSPAQQQSSSSSVLKFPCSEEGCDQKFRSDQHTQPHWKTAHHNQIDPASLSRDRTCGCGKVFRRPSDMKSHQTTCSQIPGNALKNAHGTQKCSLCGKSVRHQDMWEHTRAHVGDFALRCPNAPRCPYVFPHSGMIHGHMSNNCRFNAPTESQLNYSRAPRASWKETYLYTCETCGYETYRRLMFRTHLDQIHERLSSKHHTCPVTGCGATFTVRQSVDLHLSVHKFQEVALQQCDLCPEKVATEKMKAHLAGTHQRTEILSCPQCPFVFWSRIPLVEHQFIHRHLGLFCDICGTDVQYSRHCDLRKHHATKHHVEFPRFSCDSCDKDFGSRDTLSHHRKLKHSRTADKEKNYVCPECGNSFQTSQRLKRHHDVVHLGVREEVCEVCGEAFGSRGVLKIHQRIHTEERPFECPTCGQRFRHKEVLKRHEQSHAEKGDSFKPYGAMKKIRKRKHF